MIHTNCLVYNANITQYTDAYDHQLQTYIHETYCKHNFILFWLFYTTREPLLSNAAT